MGSFRILLSYYITYSGLFGTTRWRDNVFIMHVYKLNPSIPHNISIERSSYTNPKTHRWKISVPVCTKYASKYVPAT